MGKSYRPKDHFFQKAKQEGFRARSAFKLEEIAKRFKLLRRGGKVLDLGAAPGGFLQVIADAVGPKGLAVGVDLAPIRPMGKAQVKTAVLDVLADDFEERLATLHHGLFDVVISDLAPKTSGIRARDEARSLALAERALVLAETWTPPGSSFLTKLFMGGDFPTFRDAMRARYAQVKVVRPEATRGASMEVYLVGLQRASGGPKDDAPQ